MATPTRPSIFDELRAQYEAARVGAAAASHDHEGYEALNARMRRTYAWLDKALSYLDGVKPAIAHRYDVGHGVTFADPSLCSAANRAVSPMFPNSKLACRTSSAGA